MQQPLRRWLGFLLILALGASVSCTQSDESDGPEVVVYCSADTHVATLVFDEFTLQTSIRVRYLGDTEATKTVGLLEKVRAEKNNPRADVFWSSDAFQLAALAGEGVFSEIEDATLADWPAHARDEQRRWVAFSERTRVIVANTLYVTDERMPRTMWELTDPNWKDRVVMARPQFGTTRTHMAALVAAWGEEAAREWLTLMKANGLRLVDGNSTVVREVGSGAAYIGLTDTDDVWSGQRNGWPVQAVYVTHDRDVRGFALSEGGAMVIANAAAPILGAPNPREAQQFIRFLLSERSERLIASSVSRNMPVRPALADEFADDRIERPMRPLVSDVIRALPVAMRLCEEIL